MKILFMSLVDYRTIMTNGIYTSLLRVFLNHGDEIFVLSPVEQSKKYDGKKIITEGKSIIYKFQIGDIQKTSIIKKGINTLLVDRKFISVIKQNLSDIRFDLVLYPTPPITLLKVVEYIKKRDGAFSYLLLKDIFPQNAVDIGMMKTKGIEGLLYKVFRNKEKRLYQISDYIGCMSKANVNYLLNNNTEIKPSKVEICPNTIDVIDTSIDYETRIKIREKYAIPLNRIVYIYGGNLGKPQGIPFLIDCLRSQKENKEVFFLIVGSGTEYSKIERFIQDEKPQNTKLIKKLPKDEYDQIVSSSDVGLIFLDHRFTIPNFPSRLLAYTQAKIPVLASTDPNTDIGQIIEEGGFGWWCESNSTDAFSEKIKESLVADRKKRGLNGFIYMEKNYSSTVSFKIIRKHLDSKMWERE